MSKTQIHELFHWLWWRASEGRYDQEVKKKWGELQFLLNALSEKPKDMSLEELEKQAIEATLESHGWKISRCATILGIGRATLYRKINRYGITRP